MTQVSAQKQGANPSASLRAGSGPSTQGTSAARAGRVLERLNRSGKPLRHPKALCSSLEILIFRENRGRAERSQLFERSQGTAPLKNNTLEWTTRRGIVAV